MFRSLTRQKPRVIMLACLSASLLLSGCGGLLQSDRPGKQVFLLQPLSSDSTILQESTDPLPLDISFQVVPGLDTDRVLVLGEDASLMPIASAVWADNLPEVMTSIVRRSLTLSGKYAPAFDERNQFRIKSRLQLELQAFYAKRYGTNEPNRVEISIEGRLNCAGKQHSLLLVNNEAISGSGLAQIVAAHQRALDKTMTELLQALDTHCLLPESPVTQG